MTDNVYFSRIYRGYMQSDNIIREVDKEIIDVLINACKPDDLFIYSTWGEVDSELIKLLDKSPQRCIIYSGMDWHDTGVRKSFHEYISKRVPEVVYVGNTDGPGYFSYWLFFVNRFFKTYKVEEVTPTSIDYLYMSLNRKPHRHRVDLVRRLEASNLVDYGLVSLGAGSGLDINPIYLSDDIAVTIGDKAVGYNNEGITNDIASLGKLNNWNRHLINVVTETTHFSNTFISEKTWKPIIGLRPFIIVGDVKIYDYLKEYGIDTFDDLFGTGYNNSDYGDRIDWAIKALKQFKDTDYTQLFEEIYPRLIKNKLQMKEIFELNNNKFQQVVTNIRS